MKLKLKHVCLKSLGEVNYKYKEIQFLSVHLFIKSVVQNEYCGGKWEYINKQN